MTIATGDIRVLGGMSGPGGAVGMAGPGFIPWSGLAIMDSGELFWGNSEFGGAWDSVAMHEIMHLGYFTHTYDLPPTTIMGDHDLGGAVDNRAEYYSGSSEAVFPGDHDNVHGMHMYRPDSNDIDLYQFTLDREGVFSAETIAERFDDSSLLNSTLTLFDADGNRIARNDDYFSDDAYIEVRLQPGTYSIAVTASGNDDFDPVISNTGIGGTTQGNYDLRLNFRPAGADHLVDATGTLFDGDADGIPGGVYDFWFNVQTDDHVLFVDKADSLGIGNPGSRLNPYATIPEAFAAAQPGDVVRIVGNNFANDDPDVPASLQDNIAYEIGKKLLGGNLADGAKMEVPQGVTVMIDAGAVFKLRGANIDVGTLSQGINHSLGALQVLGTPEHGVSFTSYHDESLGVDTEPLTTTPSEGDWGGLVFRNDLDYDEVEAGTPGYQVLETEGIFLNYVNHADMRYGGGQVRVFATLDVYTPIHMIEARPTVSHNTITNMPTPRCRPIRTASWSRSSRATQQATCTPPTTTGSAPISTATCWWPSTPMRPARWSSTSTASTACSCVSTPSSEGRWTSSMFRPDSTTGTSST